MESGIEGLELSDNVNYDRVCDLFITRKTLADARSGARLMTTKELADVLGVSLRTVQQAIKGKGYEIIFAPLQTKGGVQNVACVTEAQATAIKIELQNRSKVSKNGFNSLTISNDLEMLAVQKKLSEYQDMRIAQLTAQIKEQAPKVEVYNRLIDRSGLVNIRETAKELNVKVKVLVVWLIGHGWCFRGKHGEITATAEAVRRKLMAIRECESHGKVFQQSLIAAKGRAKLALALGGGKFQELGFERG